MASPSFQASFYKGSAFVKEHKAFLGTVVGVAGACVWVYRQVSNLNEALLVTQERLESERQLRKKEAETTDKLRESTDKLRDKDLEAQRKLRDKDLEAQRKSFEKDLELERALSSQQLEVERALRAQLQERMDALVKAELYDMLKRPNRDALAQLLQAGEKPAEQ